MNKRAPYLILVAVALVCVVSVVATRRNPNRTAGQGETATNERVNAEASTDTGRSGSEMDQGRNAAVGGEASKPAIPPARPGEGANAPPPGTESTPATSETAPAAAHADELDLNLDTADLLNPTVLKRLLEQYKNATELYKQMPESRRDELITALWADQKLNDAAAELLTLAETSARRASILTQVHPRGPEFDGNPKDADPAATDQTLVDLLNAPTTSPIERDEMLTRISLASELGPANGLEWARKAKKELPGDFRVSLRADSQVLRAAASGVEITPQEREAAEAEILQAAQQDQWTDATPWDRIDAYYAMLNASDPEKARSFYRQQLAREQNPEARGVLNSLLAILDNSPQ